MQALGAALGDRIRWLSLHNLPYWPRQDQWALLLGFMPRVEALCVYEQPRGLPLSCVSALCAAATDAGRHLRLDLDCPLDVAKAVSTKWMQVVPLDKGIISEMRTLWTTSYEPE